MADRPTSSPVNQISSAQSKKKRIQKGTACTACHSKKRRCDAKRPTCSTCIRDGEPECVYTELKLKPRILLLEEKVHDLQAQVDLLQSTALTRSESTQPHPLRVTALPMPPGARQHGSTPFPNSVLQAGSGRASQQLRVQSHDHVNPPLGSWWSTGDPPPSGLITMFTRIFAEQEHQHTHDPRSSEFYASLHDPDPATGPHPALRNVIFLLACVHDRARLSHLEPVFLRRTMYHLNHSLATVDRLSDFIEAYTLLGLYHIYKGRYFQGVRNAATTILIAAACGLHVLRPPNWHSDNTPCILPPPHSRAEILSRLRVWWMIFTLNRLGSAANDIPNDFGDDRIESIWELPPESSEYDEASLTTVSSLYIPNSPATYVYNDTANTLRSKCAALVERAAHIGFVAPSQPAENTAYWDTFWAIERAIQQVAASLPSMFDEPHFQPGPTRVKVSRGRGKANPFSVVPHTLICDAAIFLHTKLARTGVVASRDACLDAAHRIMRVVRQIIQQNMRAVSSYLPVIWARVFREFGREFDRLKDAGELEKARMEILPELKTLARAIRDRIPYFPLARVFIADLRKQFPSLLEEPGVF
ncbi:hypothetical protein BOTBODRAFT_215701 [Botryobasidium botryosum FD-172 SS1]|uniref:Zn(2)-C6 fungal-type domain-containing protein n=1 Tax=Botryobasidium botryosum (strain FD-172 SS1) TaxID=930990 RepID=A0A067NDN9_BOTB1|nr:hypothetical protein BOTBODRAFT_215701 [Botryobasidium botryosum FD-172 SS1]